MEGESLPFIFCKVFRDLGYNAFSCDIQPCIKSGNPSWHIKADVTPLLSGRKSRFYTQDGKRHQIKHWHLIIAHPPCTYICRVSSIHMKANVNWTVKFQGEIVGVNKERYFKMRRAVNFFHLCLKAKCDYLAVENPIPMRLAQLPPPDCFASPHWFGVKYTKKTLYWLRNLPPLLPEATYPNPKEYVRSSRGKYRSRTFPQMAQAIARQWSNFILDDIHKHNK